MRQQDVISTTRKALDLKSDLRREQKDFWVEALNLAMSNKYFWQEGSHYNHGPWGGKYTPTVANLLMSQWEETSIFGKVIPEISLYKRYIDNITILWDGTEDNLRTFLASINDNSYGLKFTGSWDLQELSFLDLALMKCSGQINTKTFFKETDRNSSTHSQLPSPQMAGGIPKGPLMRI